MSYLSILTQESVSESPEDDIASICICHKPLLLYT